MKFITISLLFTIIFGIEQVYCQDTTQNQKLSEKHTYPINTTRSYQNPPSTNSIYRDTRLGGSSPLYNTYKKNDYGAGAITTDPNKGRGIANYENYDFKPKKSANKIYRDTRLGGSSPLYNTYKKNDYGAGAITTNPHK